MQITPTTPPPEQIKGNQCDAAARDAPSNFLIGTNGDVEPDLSAINPDHYLLAVRHLIGRAEEIVTDIINQEYPTFENTVEALARVVTPLQDVCSIIRSCGVVKSSDHHTREAELSLRVVESYFSELWTNAKLYETFKKTRETEPDTVERHLRDVLARAFMRQGIQLPRELQIELREVRQELITQAMKFANNLLASERAWALNLSSPDRLSGLPPAFKSLAEKEARKRGTTGYTLTLQGGIYNACMTYLDDRDLRASLFAAFNARASHDEYDNREIVKEILHLRQREARLLESNSYSDLATQSLMCRTTAAARSFLIDLQAGCTELAWVEIAEMKKIAPQLDRIEPWDVQYLRRKKIEQSLNFHAEALIPYLPLELVLERVFEKCKEIFGITATRVMSASWDPSVYTYRLKNLDGAESGTVYLDLFPRPGEKRSGASCEVLRSGDKYRSAEFVGLISANIQRIDCAGTSCINLTDALTLFHEVGHLGHFAGYRGPYAYLGGQNIEFDAIEIASRVTDRYACDPETLWNHDDGAQKTPPSSVSDSLARSRTYFNALGMLKRIGLALLDLDLHGSEIPEDIVGYSRLFMERFFLAPLSPNFAHILGFDHLFDEPTGYASRFYSYLWADAVVAEIHSNLDNSPDPIHYRAQLMGAFSAGATRPAAEIFGPVLGTSSGALDVQKLVDELR